MKTEDKAWPRELVEGKLEVTYKAFGPRLACCNYSVSDDHGEEENYMNVKVEDWT